MARVEWSRRAPEEIEHVLSILLYREHPSAVRIRPSVGDGGIDVLVPVQGGHEVYQIKSFATNLGPSQKRQIEDSFKRLLEYAQQHHLTITTWHLLLPLDPTNPNLDWLKSLTAEATFPCDWMGLVAADSLAAKYPDVIDYYLRDGKDRLESALAELVSVMRLGSQVAAADETPLLPANIEQSLADLHRALNRYDPHYRYDFAITGQPPVPTPRPGLVATVDTRVGESYIIWDILAKFNEATQERPVTGNLTFKAESESQLAQDLHDFALFGKPFEAPAGTVSGVTNMPGGFSRTLDGGSVIVGPNADDDRPFDLRLQLVDADDTEISAVRLKMRRTVGPSLQGMRVYGADERGILSFELRHRAGTDNMTFTVGRDLSKLTGLPPTEVVAALRLLDGFHPPNRMRVLPLYGPAVGLPMDIPDSVEPGNLGVILHVVEALAVIQDHTPIQIRVPDLQQVTESEGAEWMNAAQLLRGETLTVEWEGLSAEIPAERVNNFATPGSGSTFAIEGPFTITIAGTMIELGRKQTVLESCSVELHDRSAESDHVRVSLVPFGSKAAHVRLVKQ